MRFIPYPLQLPVSPWMVSFLTPELCLCHSVWVENLTTSSEPALIILQGLAALFGSPLHGSVPNSMVPSETQRAPSVSQLSPVTQSTALWSGSGAHPHFADRAPRRRDVPALADDTQLMVDTAHGEMLTWGHL